MAPSLISGGDDESTRPERIFVAELQEHHHGRRVRIESKAKTDPWAVEGNLWGVNRETVRTELNTFANKPYRTRAHTETTITVGPMTLEVSGTEEVTFL
jgi:L-lysine 2,3-aminomutase